eukprot:3480146-Rhodomonas_salina.1
MDKAWHSGRGHWPVSFALSARLTGLCCKGVCCQCTVAWCHCQRSGRHAPVAAQAVALCHCCCRGAVRAGSGSAPLLVHLTT